MTDPLLESPTEALNRFIDLVESERTQLRGSEEASRWLFIDRKLSRGELAEFNFYGFHGRQHVLKFFQWIQGAQYVDYFDKALSRPLVEVSSSRDESVFRRLEIDPNPAMLANIGLYNAQDFLYQRMYPVPESQKVRRILDFGAGHGRMANLAFGAPGSDVQFMVAVDSIPGSYLTQRLYYSVLGCRLFDYLDDQNLPDDFEDLARDYDLIHLPAWRLHVLPDNFFDMICCVQVLREIPQRLFLQVVSEFRRILRPGGALYVRDSNEMHNPNQLPQDSILSTCGFLLEFYPRVKNLRDIHGIPRIWRKFDPDIFVMT